MSEPKHKYTSGHFTDEDGCQHVVEPTRWTRTSGPEWDALMERANFMLGHVHPESGEAHILRDLLAYLGEQP